MERWMQVHGVTTREQWEAQQPKPEPDQWDCYLPALSPSECVAAGAGQNNADRTAAIPGASRYDPTRRVLLDDISCHCLVGDPGHPCG